MRAKRAGEAIEQRLFETRVEWRAWLEANHTRAESLWLVTWKVASGRPHLGYDAIVEEALCFGWVDAVPRKRDAESSMLLLAPRKSGSAWSALNKRRVEAMTAAGLMRPAGLALVEEAKRSGMWTHLDDVETLVLPPDLVTAFSADETAARFFAAFPKSSKRGILEWIKAAKKPETRAARIAETVRLAHDNIKANFPAGRNAGPKPKD